MKHVLRLAILGLATTSLINCTDADEQAPSGDDTQIDRNDDGAPLTPPSQDAPEKVVRSYLRGKVGAATDQLVMEKQFTANGITHVRLEQTVSGLRVYGAYVKAAVAANGALLQSIHKVAPMSPSVARTQLADADALRTVLVELGYGIEPALLKTHGNTTTFVRTQEMYREPTVERVAYLDGRMLREGFLVVTWSQRGNQLDHTLVGGDGVIVSRELRTANESYQVYTEDPLKGGVQTVTSTGWQTGAQTTVNMTGPNVHAYLDTDANNAPDAGGTAVTDGNFGGGGVNLTTAPSTAQNKAFAVQQLFYFNNVMHDDLEAHGFTNAQGNFEGNDPVNAEAQDGSGTDNANFSTPTDGQSPRMQMYLWTGAGPNAFVHVGTTDYGAYNSSFGPQLTATATAATAMAVASPADGCTAVSGVSGKVAIIDRGTCDFVTKVTNAQTAGAKSVIIVNNVASVPFSPGGTARKISIPSVMVSQADGATLKSLVPQTATLRKNTVTPLQIDGDLDADIVFHEYGHGLTWRMIGSMSGALAGAIGEGASDVNAFLHNGDPIMAEYAFSDPAGIRRYPYNAYGLTLKDWTGAEVHNDGEIYAAAMWSVFENYLASGLTASDLLTDFVDGMNFTPAGPRPEQMRDGMLSSLAARGLTARNCNVSRGFAKLGIGVGASTSVSRRGVVTVVESFAVPAGCPAP